MAQGYGFLVGAPLYFCNEIRDTHKEINMNIKVLLFYYFVYVSENFVSNTLPYDSVTESHPALQVLSIN